MDIDEAEKFILNLLATQLSPALHYHGLHHTLDVMQEAMLLAQEEGVSDQESLRLLKTAALFHDSGFLYTYPDHEEEGCRIARAELPAFSYTKAQIDIICGMIRATKIPQKPRTHLEQILCDADLDYLGRADFEPIAASLFNELKGRGIVSDEKTWNMIQIKFLESHVYHTVSSKTKRQLIKQRRLEEIRGLI